MAQLQAPVAKGAGLGLATVYGIVEQSGGEIVLSSEPGRGTTIAIYLPRVNADPDEDSRRRRETAAAGGPETILLVEDESAVRTLVGRVLGNLGYTVLTAANGLDALEIVRRELKRIDLVVSDVVMPKMGGAELAGALEASFPWIKLLFISGYAERPEERRVVSGQRTAFLHKPFGPQELARKVREVLDREPQKPSPD